MFKTKIKSKFHIYFLFLVIFHRNLLIKTQIFLTKSVAKFIKKGQQIIGLLGFL